jgi:hypothetical protein
MDEEKKSPRTSKVSSRPAEGERRVRFAREMARAELGRFYFSDRQARELREAAKVKPKRRD